MALLTFLSVTALAQASIEPVQTVTCQPAGNIVDGAIENLTLVCPPVEIDPDGYMDYLNALIDTLPERLELPRSQHVRIEESVSLTYAEDGWRLTEPTPLIRVFPDYPLRAARYRVSGRCSIRLNVSEAGQAEVTATACETFRGGAARSSNMFEHKSLQAIEQFVWLPMPGQAQTCHTTVLDYQIGDHTAPESPIEGAPTCPTAP